MSTNTVSEALEQQSTTYQQHQFELDVQIFDTDCYGVMWHGAYTKWLEMGRVELLKQCGQTLSPPTEKGSLIYPVVEQNIKYKSPGRLNDTLVLTTQLNVDKHKLNFTQVFRQKETAKVVVEAITTCLVLNEDWKPYRRIPESLLQALSI